MAQRATIDLGDRTSNTPVSVAETRKGRGWLGVTGYYQSVRGGDQVSGDTDPEDAKMAKLIHTMVRVLDLERSLRFYRDAFGLEEVHRLDFPTFALVYLRNSENDFEVELTLNKDRKEPYTHGDGYGHFAVCVDDVARERERFAQIGCAPGDVKEFKDGAGALLARYFFVQDPDGYKIEVLERHGHYR